MGEKSDELVGAKSVHRERVLALRREAMVEVGERRCADKEKRKAVGEAHAVVETGFTGREDGAEEFFADANQPAFHAEIFAEPGGGDIAAILGLQAFAFPNAHRAQRRPRIGRARNDNGACGVGGQGERVGRECGRDERHARKRALREQAAGLIDDHEPAVADEAEGVHVRGGDGAGAEGLDGVDEEAVQMHGRPDWDCGEFLPVRRIVATTNERAGRVWSGLTIRASAWDRSGSRLWG